MSATVTAASPQKRKRGRRGLVKRIARPFVFLVLIFGLVGGAELSSALATEFLSTQEAELTKLINEERTERGLPELATSEALRTIARRWSQQMMLDNKLYHNPNLFGEYSNTFPDWQYQGENVGVGPTIPIVHQAFMDSPGHRANILDNDWSHVGVGVISGGGRLWMTENFLGLFAGSRRPAPASFRLAGSTRTGTAQEIADFGWSPGSAGGAVLSDAFDFHGALAGASLAGAVNGPSVLTATDSLSPEASEALKRALGQGSGKNVYLIGAFSPSVASAVSGLGLNPISIGSADHAATAADVARQISAPSAAFVTTVTNFPDALAAAAVSAVTGWPILYTDPSSLSAATSQVLAERGINRVYILGGAAAVSPTVEAQLAGQGIVTSRLAGPGRVDTAIEIANFGLGVGLTPRHVQVATAWNFPDALAGGGLGGSLRAPVLLTDAGGLNTQNANWLAAHRTEVNAVYLLGGTGALSSQVEAGVFSALS